MSIKEYLINKEVEFVNVKNVSDAGTKKPLITIYGTFIQCYISVDVKRHLMIHDWLNEVRYNS